MVAVVQADTGTEMNLLKKMMQNKIDKLTKENEAVSKECDEERKKKEKILANARRKIKQLQLDMDELRKSKASDEPTKEPTVVRPLPEGKVAIGKLHKLFQQHSAKYYFS